MPPRAIRPKDDTKSESGDTPSETKTSKRRAVSSACIPCRKRKSKCDGSAPSCSTCTAVYRTECYYDQDSDHRRKGALKRDIQSLQQQNDALDVIVASLRALPEADAVNLLHSIRNDDNAEETAASLQTNVRLPHSFSDQTLESEFVQHMSQPTPTSMTSETPPMGTMLSPCQSRTDENFFPAGAGSGVGNSAAWFRTPQDPELIEHLFSLYFAWVHPFYHFFNKDLFLHDFRRGGTEHCSSLLVHAILASGCHYSDRTEARSDATNPATAGDHYFAEAKKMLDREEKPSLTTVQAIGVIAPRETSAGRDSNGYQYTGRCVRMALEMGLHLSAMGRNLRPIDFEARKITFWAVFNLETTCSVGLGRLSQLPRAAADVAKPNITERSESQTWRPYEDTNLVLSPSAEQPARDMTFIRCLSDLSELASDMVNTFYAPRERFTSRRLATSYEQYRQWYQNLPDCFRLENTSLPHVLLMHMYYYACVLHLFRPYIKLDLRGANLFPRDNCTFCANEISALMSALRAMYGLRRTTLPITGMLLSASTIHLLNLPSEQSATHLSQGMHDLKAMSVNHYFAGRCVDIIRSLATKWNIQLPPTAPPPSASPFRSGQNSASPRKESAFFAPSIPRQRSNNSGASSTDPQASRNDSPFALPVQQPQPQQDTAYYSNPFTAMDPMDVETSFWVPFPSQGMPTLQQDLATGTEQFAFNAGGQPSSWPQYHMPNSGGVEAPQQQQHLQVQTQFGDRYSAPGRVDEHMDGNMREWSW